VLFWKTLVKCIYISAHLCEIRMLQVFVCFQFELAIKLLASRWWALNHPKWDRNLLVAFLLRTPIFPVMGIFIGARLLLFVNPTWMLILSVSKELIYLALFSCFLSHFGCSSNVKWVLGSTPAPALMSQTTQFTIESRSLRFFYSWWKFEKLSLAQKKIFMIQIFISTKEDFYDWWKIRKLLLA
jgi:hypothetical protein